MFKISSVTRVACAVIVLLASRGRADAQGWDLTFFVGRAFPTYDERLTLRPSTPSVPGVDISVVGSPLLKADGGPVFGGALAFEFGILGIEGRLDATEVGLEFTGARYNLRGTEPPFEGLTASVTLADGRFDADRIPLLSVNARIRTPGPVALVASGGLSYLNDVTVTGFCSDSRRDPGYPFDPVRPKADARRSARPVGPSLGRERRRGPAHRRTRSRNGRGPGLLLPRV